MESNYMNFAVFICRVILGVLFFAQGIDKVFNIKIRGVADAYRYPETNTHIPSPVIYLISAYTSIIEMVAGLFLIPGLGTPFALFLLGIDMVLVCIGMSWKQPLWDMKHVWPRLVMLVFLLAMEGHDKFSIDSFIGL